MLFNSYEFLFAFLPVTLLGLFFVRARYGLGVATAWLVLASLFYYGWWNPAYLPIIVVSMVLNFSIGQWVVRLRGQAFGRLVLAVGIGLNLAALGYFKYANWLIDSANAGLGTSFHVEHIVLPLAISFFTFQQIAYLADCSLERSEGGAREYSFMQYALFVSFFPQLIAGPIVHHSEMMPQFARPSSLTPQAVNIAVGGTLFAIGLFKKAVLADGVAVYSTPVFDTALAGGTLTFFEAWGGALAYTMQLYFDFSGYSDMALGAARMCGILLPLNFFSPYKATSIIEFWRRWHMTLSRFLRDYLYIPLGGSRHGNARRWTNLMITMLLGGLWHGAGWTFVAWGGLHGAALAVNHAWRGVRGGARPAGLVGRCCAWALTFAVVVVGWVLFRAESFPAALLMLTAMFDLGAIALPAGLVAALGPDAAEQLAAIGIGATSIGGAAFVLTYLWVAALLLVVTLVPNTSELLRRYRPAHSRFAGPSADALGIGLAAGPVGALARRLYGMWCWRPTLAWGLAIAACAAAGVLALTRVSEFLYFQF